MKKLYFISSMEKLIDYDVKKNGVTDVKVSFKEMLDYSDFSLCKFDILNKLLFDKYKDGIYRLFIIIDIYSTEVIFSFREKNDDWFNLVRGDMFFYWDYKKNEVVKQFMGKACSESSGTIMITRNHIDDCIL